MRAEFDPEQYRMTVGEHLEELRRRLVLGLIGFGIALIVCFTFARSHVIPAFCAPLYNTLKSKGVSTQLVTNEVSEGFVVFLQMSMITAVAVSGPWLLYQLWQFVAAGLYPNERKYITRYLPLSIALLISGMLLVYLFVLPWTLDFFLGFSIGIPVPQQTVYAPASTQPIVRIPALEGDPEQPLELQIWFDALQQRLKMFHGGEVRVIPFGSDELLRPEITLQKYINLVVAMLISFGLSFQLPLVVLALVRIGIVDIQTLKSSRRYIYFGLAILAAVITPGGDIIPTIALMVPLMLLYELGIWLARAPKPRAIEGGGGR